MYLSDVHSVEMAHSSIEPLTIYYKRLQVATFQFSNRLHYLNSLAGVNYEIGNMDTFSKIPVGFIAGQFK